MSPAELEVIAPEHYQQHGYPHEAWAWLRKHDPIRRFEPPNFRPFWAVVRHEDMFQISRNPHRFINAPRLALFPSRPEDVNNPPLRHLINMDPPGAPGSTAAWCRSASRRARSSACGRPRRRRVADLLRDLQDRPRSTSSPKFSAVVPLAVLADLLGVPRDDWRQLFQLDERDDRRHADPDFQNGEDGRRQ